MATAIGLFGGNSDGSIRMEDWLRVMCKGCVNDRGRGATDLGGMSCDLPGRAYGDPYEADMPEWSADASSSRRPELVAELGDGPWPVCMAYKPRKRRADAGRPRQPQGVDTLFDEAVAR